MWPMWPLCSLLLSSADASPAQSNPAKPGWDCPTFRMLFVCLLICCCCCPIFSQTLLQPVWSLNQVRTGPARPGWTWPDQTRLYHNRPDQTRPDQTRPDQTRLDHARTDQTRPGRTCSSHTAAPCISSPWQELGHVRPSHAWPDQTRQYQDSPDRVSQG